MTDHEKVMSWLEGLTFDDWRDYHSDSEVQTIAKEAFALLKKQEPMQVLSQRENVTLFNRYKRKGFCPNCNQVVEWYLNRSYCGFCGQELKWE